MTKQYKNPEYNNQISFLKAKRSELYLKSSYYEFIEKKMKKPNFLIVAASYIPLIGIPAAAKLKKRENILSEYFSNIDLQRITMVSAGKASDVNYLADKIIIYNSMMKELKSKVEENNFNKYEKQLINFVAKEISQKDTHKYFKYETIQDQSEYPLIKSRVIDKDKISRDVNFFLEQYKRNNGSIQYLPRKRNIENIVKEEQVPVSSSKQQYSNISNPNPLREETPNKSEPLVSKYRSMFNIPAAIGLDGRAYY